METTTQLANLKAELQEKQGSFKELNEQITKMTLLQSDNREKFLLLGGETALDALIALCGKLETDIDLLQKQIIELRQLNLFDHGSS